MLVKSYFQGIPWSLGVPAPPWPPTAANPGGPPTPGALGRKFLRLDQFLKSTSGKADENVPNPKLFP